MFQRIDGSEQERGHDPDAQSVQRHEDNERNHQGQNERDRTLESLVVGQNIPLLPGAIPTFGQWHSRSRSPRLSESGLGVNTAGGGDYGAKGTRPDRRLRVVNK